MSQAAPDSEAAAMSAEMEEQPRLRARIKELEAQLAAAEAEAEELSGTAERYRIIDELSSDYIYLDEFDEQGRMKPLWVTSAFERMTGYPVEAAQDDTLLGKLAHPDDLQPFIAHYQRLMNQEPGDFVGRLIRKDGTELWVRHIARPVVDPQTGRTKLLYGCVRDITDWMKAEQQAQIYSRRYRVISEMSEEISMLARLQPDGDMDLLWVTDAFERLTGYTLEDTQSYGFLARVLPDDPEHSLLRQLEALRAGVASTAEGPLLTKWGATIWVRSTARPFTDENTGEHLVFASLRDITRRRMAEAALRDSEQMLRAAQRVGKIGSWEYTQADDSVLWSAEMYRLFGVDAESFTPSLDSFMQLVRPDDREAVSAAWQRSLAETVTFSVEFRALLPGGGERIFYSRAEVVSDAAGAAQRMFGTFQDITEIREKEQALQAAYTALEESNLRLQAEITERLAAEETLRQSEDRYRRLLESMEEGVILADFEERHLYANPAAERIYGVGPGELVDRQITDFIDETTLAQFHDETMRRKAGEHSLYDFEITRPDGEKRRLRNSVSPVRNAAGEVIASMGVFTDITEQEQLRQRLLDEQREESVVMLAGGIAHDFNNMLTGVLGAAAMIEAGLPEGERENRELAQVIGTSATRMADLTGKLLAYARGGKYQTRSVDLNQSVHNVSLMVRGKLPPRVQVELDLGADLPPVEADMGQIEQVLLNLMVNAIEAIESAGHGVGLVRVSTGSESLSQRHLRPPQAGQIGEGVRVSVHDTGGGMSAATLERVFEPFFSTKFQGRGLGLAACSGIVRNHGGALWAESTPGQGSVFHLLLPASRRRLEAAPPEEELIVSAGRRILVIDDDPDALTVTRRMLESRRYAVRSAASGREGIAAWREARTELDLIILDMQMPDLSGTEVLRQIRSEDPAIRVLMASGYAADDALKALSGLHISGFISKPFGPRELTRAVEAAFGTLRNP